MMIDWSQAMILAHERSSYYGDLLQHVRAVVFLGVPHRGSDIAYWAAFAAKILRVGQLGFQANPVYIEALQRNSPTFANISTQFIERAVPLSIRTFYETEMMGNQLVSSQRLSGLMRKHTHNDTDCGQRFGSAATPK